MTVDMPPAVALSKRNAPARQSLCLPTLCLFLFLPAPQSFAQSTGVSPQPQGTTAFVIDGNSGTIDAVTGGIASVVATLNCQACRWDVALDQQGNLIVAAQSLYKVTAGQQISQIAVTGSPEEASAPFYQSVAVDEEGNYVVADAANKLILRITPQGTVLSWYTYAGRYLTSDVVVRVDSSQNTIVAEDECYIALGDEVPDSCAGVHLYEIPASAANGSAAVPIGFTPAVSGGPAPGSVAGMTLDANGNYVITDWWNAVIFTIAPVGGVKSAPGTATYLYSNPDDILCYPVGIYRDPSSGDFFLVDFDNEALYTLSPDGSQLDLILQQSDQTPEAVIVKDLAVQNLVTTLPDPPPIPPLVLTGGALPGGSSSEAYSASVSATGGEPPYTYAASGLPAGISLNPYSGAISGSTTATGNFNVAITVTDQQPVSASAAFALAISAPPPVAVPDGTVASTVVNTPLSITLTATGGGPPYTWALASGTLPPGLTLQSSGTLAGTPLTVGTYSFAARATDTFGGSAVGTFSITILPPPLTSTTPSPLPSGMVSVSYGPVSLTASGGTGPYTFAITSGALPAGLTLSSNGVITGTPTAATASGGTTFTVTISDAEHPPATGTAALTISVSSYTPDLVLSASSASFTLNTPAAALPLAQTVQVTSSNVNQTLGYAVSVSPSTATWVSATAGGNTTPGSFTVGLTSAALNLAASATAYTATVTVTCTSGPCSGNTHTVGASLTVTNAPAQLTVLSTLLAFNTQAANPEATTESLSIQNTGGGTIGFASVTCAAPWCTVSGVPGAIGAGATAQLSVTANPAGLSAGYYYTSLAILSSAGSANVPVTLFIAANGLLSLSPAGALFTLPQGGAAVGDTSFLVSVSGTQAVSFTAAVSPSVPWLSVTQSAATASGAAPATVNLVFNQAQVALLAAGTYYATVVVTSANASNSPQSFEVVVNVTPAAQPTAPNPVPGGLIFLTQAAQTPPQQTVSVYTGSATAVSYQASAAANGGGSWLSVSPLLGTTSAGTVGQSEVTVNAAGLMPGVYTGAVSYQFSATAVRSVNVTLVIENVTPAAANAGAERAALTGCTASKIVPTSTALVSNFAAPASWPIELAVNLVDDCGSPIVNGQVAATFSNGDPPLVLALSDGLGDYVGTWTPAHAAAQIAIAALASAKGLPNATLQLAGAVTANNAPILTASAMANFFNPVGGAPLAPGTLVQITGQYLAGQTLSASAIPLPQALGGTSVIIGGRLAPVSSVSPGQIDAQVPFELAAGQPYEVIVSANNALTTPQSFQAGAASPGLSVLPSGYVQANHQSGAAVTEAAPAKPGEYISVYLVGMGATTIAVASGQAGPGAPFADTTIAPTITLNNETTTFVFSGLIPGLVGVYQVNLEVPTDALNGDLPLTFTESGFVSNSGLLPVHD